MNKKFASDWQKQTENKLLFPVINSFLSSLIILELQKILNPNGVRLQERKK